MLIAIYDFDCIGGFSARWGKYGENKCNKLDIYASSKLLRSLW